MKMVQWRRRFVAKLNGTRRFLAVVDLLLATSTCDVGGPCRTSYVPRTFDVHDEHFRVEIVRRLDKMSHRSRPPNELPRGAQKREKKFVFVFLPSFGAELLLFPFGRHHHP